MTIETNQDETAIQDKRIMNKKYRNETRLVWCSTYGACGMEYNLSITSTTHKLVTKLDIYRNGQWELW